MLNQNILDKKYNFLRPIKINRLIRLGREMDGGYIVDSNIIDNCDTLITFGLGDSSQIEDQWSFETDFIKRNKKLSIFVYDYTVSASPYIKKILKYLRRFITFRTSLEAVKIRIKNYQEYIKFMRLDNVKYYREKITYPIKNKIDTDIKKVFSRIKNNSEVILKCDIEGSEYRILDQLIKYQAYMTGLVIEFHDCDLHQYRIKNFIENFNLQLVHLHVNNWGIVNQNNFPSTLELTFSPKQFNRIVDKTKKFPIPLDLPNNPLFPDRPIEFNDSTFIYNNSFNS